MHERSCTICGCDITNLHPNSKRCLRVSCSDAQKKIDRDKRNKTTAKLNGARVRFLTGLGGIDTQPYRVGTPRPIRSSGGTNVTRDVLNQQKSEEWARMTRKGVGT
jgi:hypothetical protein